MLIHQKDKVNQRMSIWGIGPSFVILSIGYSIIMFLLTYYFYPIFQINIKIHHILIILGIILIIFGIPFFIISAITINRAYNNNRLVTTGIYQCCRHPLYASWVVFIVPGIVLLSGSWIGLTVPIFMYIILHILVQKEETYLEKLFGNEYLLYKKKVPCILPYGYFIKKP